MASERIIRSAMRLYAIQVVQSGVLNEERVMDLSTGDIHHRFSKSRRTARCLTKRHKTMTVYLLVIIRKVSGAPLAPKEII
jgi:hypothetical protein